MVFAINFINKNGKHDGYEEYINEDDYPNGQIIVGVVNNIIKNIKHLGINEIVEIIELDD